mgnify:CR=1 FL=1
MVHELLDVHKGLLILLLVGDDGVGVGESCLDEALGLGEELLVDLDQLPLSGLLLSFLEAYNWLSCLSLAFAAGLRLLLFCDCWRLGLRLIQNMLCPVVYLRLQLRKMPKNCFEF